MSDVALARVHDKDYRIIVNATPQTVESDIISYEEVVLLAYPTPAAETIYSVVYDKAKKPPHEGELLPERTVEIKEGTEFDVTPTGRS